MCVKKIIYCCNYTKIPDVWWEHLDLVTHEISQNVFNYYYFLTVHKLQNIHMQTFYDS